MKAVVSKPVNKINQGIVIRTQREEVETTAAKTAEADKDTAEKVGADEAREEKAVVVKVESENPKEATVMAIVEGRALKVTENFASTILEATALENTQKTNKTVREEVILKTIVGENGTTFRNY